MSDFICEQYIIIPAGILTLGRDIFRILISFYLVKVRVVVHVVARHRNPNLMRREVLVILAGTCRYFLVEVTAHVTDSPTAEVYYSVTLEASFLHAFDIKNTHDILKSVAAALDCCITVVCVEIKRFACKVVGKL